MNVFEVGFKSSSHVQEKQPEAGSPSVISSIGKEKIEQSSLSQSKIMHWAQVVVVEVFCVRTTSTLTQVVYRIILIIAAVGLCGGYFLASKWVISASVCFFMSGGAVNFACRRKDGTALRKTQEVSVKEKQVSVDAAEVQEQRKGKSHVSPDVLSTVTEFAKYGRKITQPNIMAQVQPLFLEWLQGQTEQSFHDLNQVAPDKLVNLIENFPEAFVRVCPPRQIAQFATYAYQAGLDGKNRAMGALLNLISEQGSNTTLYEYLIAFAETPLFNSALENQLLSFKKKLGLHFRDQSGRTPAQLFDCIHRNIEAEQARKRELALRKPVISEKRKAEIQAFAKELIADPTGNHFGRRRQLLEMMKHEHALEIPFLVECLGHENIVKLWIFEATVDNRALEPDGRLVQMYQKLSSEQFDVSLLMDAFHHVIERCPQAALEFDAARLEQLADTEKSDEALYELSRKLHEDSAKIPGKEEKKKSLRRVVERVDSKRALVLARQRELEPPIDIEAMIRDLRATMDPQDVGYIIDRMDDAQLTVFIAGLGTEERLAMFWAIQERKIVAKHQTQAQKSRLARIYTKLSSEQMIFTAKTEGFRVVLANIEDEYIFAAAEVLTATQIGIIAANGDNIFALIDLVNKFDKDDKCLFHKLHAIAENIPARAQMKTDLHREALKTIELAAGKRWPTLGEPEGGWGVHATAEKAVKHLIQLFKSKLS